MKTSLRDRYLALDVMRGLTLALMIIVNRSFEEGRSYAQLLHADWNGLTLTDLVFPSFLFVVGAALHFTVPHLTALTPSRRIGHVLRRTVILFLCGYLLYWFPFVHPDAAGHWTFNPMSHTRIPGVLQRIALCYGAAALLVSFLRFRWVLMLCPALLLGYWALLTLFGDTSITGNVVVRFDLWLLGPDHLYHGEGLPFDPEGLLSTLPALVNTLAGYMAARHLYPRAIVPGATTLAPRLLVRIGVTGIGLILLGLAWNHWLPINKKLWTPSYVCCGVGVDLIVLASLALVIDTLRLQHWTRFFVVLGRNTLVVYLSSEILAEVFWRWQINGQSFFEWAYLNGFAWVGNQRASLLFALVYLGGFWLLAWIMDKNRWYVRA
jgi:predicted acyltransferase